MNNRNNNTDILDFYIEGIEEQERKDANSSPPSYSENEGQVQTQVQPENEAAVVDAATKLARERGIDWQVYTNNTNGTLYYYNDRTKERTWQKPPEVADAEAKEVVNTAASPMQPEEHENIEENVENLTTAARSNKLTLPALPEGLTANSHDEWKEIYKKVVQENLTNNGKIDLYETNSNENLNAYIERIGEELEITYSNGAELQHKDDFKNWMKKQKERQLRIIGRTRNQGTSKGGGGRKKTRRNQNRRNQSRRNQNRKTQNRRNQNRKTQNRRKQSRRNQSRRNQNKRKQNKRKQSRKRRN